MKQWLGILVTGIMVLAVAGCRKDIPYGVEQQLVWAGGARQVWAVAPAVNLSGIEPVDPLLQADLLYQQLQQVQGLTVIPVNRVAEVFYAMRLVQIQSPQQAQQVCAALGCDGLIVPTITAYDPYNPPKMGASLALFLARTRAAEQVDPQQIVRQASPGETSDQAMPVDSGFVQVVGMYDAANGSVRDRLAAYAAGRNDPKGPMGAREYMVSMDRYAGFVYHELIRDVLTSPRLWQAVR